MCPMCLFKLRQNIKFDTRKRYEALLDAAEKCGFPEQVTAIQEVLENASTEEVEKANTAAAAAKPAVSPKT